MVRFVNPMMFDRWRAKAAERRRLEAERRAGPHPRAQQWYVVSGLRHLYLGERGAARPVCGAVVTDDAAEMNFTASDSVCPGCVEFVHEVYLPQIS